MQNIIARQKETVNHFKNLFDQARQQKQEKDARRYLHSYLMESSKLNILEDINLYTEKG
jgi:flagellar biosynthesis chaperone FliJ